MESFVSCTGGDEAPPKGDLRALHGYVEDGNIKILWNLLEMVLWPAKIPGFKQKALFGLKTTLSCNDLSGPEKNILYSEILWVGILFYLVLFVFQWF